MKGRILLSILALIWQPVLASVDVKWEDTLALKHIEAVRNSKGGGRGCYQVAKQISAEREAWLEQRLVNLKKYQFADKYRYKVLESKVKGDLAIVVLSVEDRKTPLFYETLTIGFCRVDDRWLAAPVCGSFKFTGIGSYIPEVDLAKARLEGWAKQTAQQYYQRGSQGRLVALEAQIKLRQAKGMPLSTGTKEQAASYFMEMCRSVDVVGILACFPESQRHQINAAISNEKSLWSQLLHKNFLYGILPDFDDDLVSIGLLLNGDQLGEMILELELHRDEGVWCVQLPKVFDAEIREGGPVKFPKSYRVRDGNLQFKGAVRKHVLDDLTPAAAKDADQVSTLLVQSIEANDFQLYTSLVNWKTSYLDDGLDLSAGEVDRRFLAAVRLWKLFTDPKNPRRELVNFQQADGYALASLLSYSPARLDTCELEALLFSENDGVDYWSLIPEAKLIEADEYTQLRADDVIALQTANKALKESFAKRFLTKAGEFSELELVPWGVSDTKKVVSFFRAYEQALRAGELVDACGFLAYTGGKEKQVMEAVSSHYKTQLVDVSYYKVETVLTSDSLAMLVLRLDAQLNATVTYFAYPLVQCESSGMRLLPGLQLYYEHGPGQVMMNKRTLKEAEASKSEAFYLEYLKLKDRFNTVVEAKLKNAREQDE